jgi:hypothetical protein
METKKLPEKFDCLAPDKSEIRFLCSLHITTPGSDEAIQVNGFWKIK